MWKMRGYMQNVNHPLPNNVFQINRKPINGTPFVVLINRNKWQHRFLTGTQKILSNIFHVSKPLRKYSNCTFVELFLFSNAWCDWVWYSPSNTRDVQWNKSCWLFKSIKFDSILTCRWTFTHSKEENDNRNITDSGIKSVLDSLIALVPLEFYEFESVCLIPGLHDDIWHHSG